MQVRDRQPNQDEARKQRVARISPSPPKLCAALLPSRMLAPCDAAMPARLLVDTLLTKFPALKTSHIFPAPSARFVAFPWWGDHELLGHEALRVRPSLSGGATHSICQTDSLPCSLVHCLAPAQLAPSEFLLAKLPE
ncbi:hypothetical protein PWT90_08789 [Aphanocladium album]|nr:hypothetical protein PWT90_08789 [Aphanocladium album]